MQETAFYASSGRIRLAVTMIKQGSDLLLCLSGGNAHIGAIAIADKNGASTSVRLPGHMETEIAETMARTVAIGLCRNVAVAAGIHYDHITHDEILEVIRLAECLAADALRKMKADDNGRKND